MPTRLSNPPPPHVPSHSQSSGSHIVPCAVTTAGQPALFGGVPATTGAVTRAVEFPLPAMSALQYGKPPMLVHPAWASVQGRPMVASTNNASIIIIRLDISFLL